MQYQVGGNFVDKCFRLFALLGVVIFSGCGGGESSEGTTGGPNLACTTTGSATGAAAANCMVSEMVSASGARVQWFADPTYGYVSPEKLTSTTTSGVYTMPYMDVDLNPGRTAWVASVPTGGYWGLTSTGWMEWKVGAPIATHTLTNNGSGTLTVAGVERNYTLTSIIQTDLSGQGIVCNNNQQLAFGTGSVACAVPANYPTGAIAYTATRTDTSDSYDLVDGAFTGTPDVLTDSAGVALTALPAVGTTVCVNGEVYVPITPTPGVGMNNYNIHLTSNGTCGAVVIGTAMALPATATGLVASKTVQGVAMLTMKQGTTISIAAFNAQAGNRFMVGNQYRTAGNTTVRNYVNKVAANAQLTAHGLPTLP